MWWCLLWCFNPWHCILCSWFMNPQKSWIITLVQSHLPCFLFPLTTQTIKPTGFKPGLSTSRFDRLHCNAGCRKRVTWEAYWIETGPTLLGSNAELWLQGQDEHGQVKNTYTQVPKYDVAFKPRKWKVNFMTILQIHFTETADVCWVFVLTSKTGSSRELNADECVLETEVTNLGALGLYRNLTNLAEQKSCCFYYVSMHLLLFIVYLQYLDVYFNLFPKMPRREGTHQDCTGLEGSSVSWETLMLGRPNAIRSLFLQKFN